MLHPQPAVKPVILSQSHVAKAVADTRFYALLPEYLALQAKLKTMHVDLDARRGCSSCRKRRAAANVFNDFVAITLAISPDGLNRLKSYLAAPQLMVNTINRNTGAAELRII